LTEERLGCIEEIYCCADNFMQDEIDASVLVKCLTEKW